MHNTWMPHGVCYLWDPFVVWFNVLGDSGVALAYALIPLLMWFALRNQFTKSMSEPYRNVVSWFAAFIVLCGATHVYSAVTVWQPLYYQAATVKWLTTIVSFTAAWKLYKILYASAVAFNKMLDTAEQREFVRLIMKELRQRS